MIRMAVLNNSLFSGTSLNTIDFEASLNIWMSAFCSSGFFHWKFSTFRVDQEDVVRRSGYDVCKSSYQMRNVEREEKSSLERGSEGQVFRTEYLIPTFWG